MAVKSLLKVARMSWVMRLFCKIYGAKKTKAISPFKVPLKTIPTVQPPDGYKKEWLTTPAKPKKRGKPPELYAAEINEYRQRMRTRFAELAEFNRKRAMSVGIKQYKWMAAAPDPAVTCDIGLRNNGKIFSYEAPPPEGHPCEGKCNSEDWCRCIPRSIVPGFED